MGNFSLFKYLYKIFQGTFIGLGSVLPGISGGVMCVIFGIYRPIMELLADPIKNFKTHVIKLAPYLIGYVIGFMGVANLLSILLDRYPYESVCVFIGLITGMLPSLYREAGEQGRDKNSFISMFVAMVIVFAILISLNVFSVSIVPNFAWYLFCGFALAVSIIAPGMSFSTTLMPLGLYEPFVAGIGHLDFSVLIPGAIGVIVTIVLLTKTVNMMFKKHYSMAFHAIIGIVIAATVMIIPFESFTLSMSTAIINIVCIVVGTVVALLLDKFNQKFEDQKK